MQFMAEARARAAAGTADERVRQDDVPGDDRQANRVDNVISKPDPLAAWKALMPKPEPEKRQRGLDTMPPSPIDWTAVTAVIDQRIEAERTFMREVVAEAMVEKLTEERKAFTEERRVDRAELTDEVRRLTIALADMQTTIGELRQVIATERGSRALDDLSRPRQRVQ